MKEQKSNYIRNRWSPCKKPTVTMQETVGFREGNIMGISSNESQKIRLM